MSANGSYVASEHSLATKVALLERADETLTERALDHSQRFSKTEQALLAISAKMEELRANQDRALVLGRAVKKIVLWAALGVGAVVAGKAGELVWAAIKTRAHL